jgi:GMP synthase-like glutamine amidotransferase
MKIAILQTDTVRPEFAGTYGQYPQMFARLLHQVEPTLEWDSFDVEHMEYPATLDGYDAFLITGSRASVYEDLPWIERLEEFVRELHRQRRIIIGICFGHQLVAQALGGKTEKAAVGWGVGVHAARWYQRPDWARDADDEFRLLVSHQDQVTLAARGSEVLAGSDFCPNAVCQIGDHILTFQGHPEFVTGYSRDLLQMRSEKLGEAVYQAAMESLQQSTNERDVARWIIAFIKRGAEEHESNP